MEIERKKEPIGKKKIDANCKWRNWKIQAKFSSDTTLALLKVYIYVED